MIHFEDVTFQYTQEDSRNGVFDIDLHIKSGEVILLCGESGCGKTTLTRMINGLVPHYYEGTMKGKVYVDGIDVKNSSLYDLTDVVGSVFQNPRTQFFTLDSTDEIAFGCENMGIPKEEIYRRISKAASELRIQKLLDRSLFALSGGEKQKIACASVSAMEPSIFVLDEPSSNLDVATIADLRQVIEQWKSMGKTIIIAEHRLHYLMGIADRIIYMKNGRIEEDLSVEAFLALSEQERQSMGLRSLHPSFTSEFPVSEPHNNSIEIKDFHFCYGKTEVLNIPRLTIPKGAVVGILGDNGAGKTTFAKCLCGLEKSAKGTLQIGSQRLNAKERVQKCYMVMQDVNHQLFTESVEDEILLSLSGIDESADKMQMKTILSDLNLSECQKLHPMSLSGGQKQRVAIGSAIASDKEVLVFDEPTSGLDYRHMIEVASNLKSLGKMGKTIFVITHDPELIVQCCNYFIFIEHGEIRWTGGWTTENKERLSAFNRIRTGNFGETEKI